METSKNRKSQILHGASAEHGRSIQYDKKRQFVILEEPKATKDLRLCKALFNKQEQTFITYRLRGKTV